MHDRSYSGVAQLIPAKLGLMLLLSNDPLPNQPGLNTAVTKRSLT
jgi:hypothetical protein